LTWTNGNTRSATGSQDTYAYWAGNSNYNASKNSNKVTLTVNKATDQSVTVTLTNRTYSTSSQVVASATAHGCTYYLGFGSSSTSAPTSWGSANSSISQTNAGTYYVWYKGTADANHSANIGATYKGSVTIGKANQSAPTATGATKTYPTTATATASGGGGKGSIEWSNGNTQTSVGSKTTKARWGGNGNYNASAWSNEVTVKMNKASQTISFNGSTGSVDVGHTLTKTATRSVGDGAVTYSSSNTSIATVNSSTGVVTGVAAGTCTITATAAATTNYNKASASYTISVTKKKNVKISASGTYGVTYASFTLTIYNQSGTRQTSVSKDVSSTNPSSTLYVNFDLSVSPYSQYLTSSYKIVISGSMSCQMPGPSGQYYSYTIMYNKNYQSSYTIADASNLTDVSAVGKVS
jgi:hypothetical protein